MKKHTNKNKTRKHRNRKHTNRIHRNREHRNRKHTNRKHKKGGKIVPRYSLVNHPIFSKFNDKENIKHQLINHIEYYERVYQQLESYKITLIDERIHNGEEFMNTNNPDNANNNIMLGELIEIIEHAQFDISDYIQEFRELYDIFLDYDDMNQETKDNYLSIYREIYNKINKVLDNCFEIINSYNV